LCLLLQLELADSLDYLPLFEVSLSTFKIISPFPWQTILILGIITGGSAIGALLFKNNKAKTIKKAVETDLITTQTTTENLVEILKIRYAKREINKEEYHDMMRLLHESEHST